ncbi:MAG TPA: EI24 domain-containing protein [Micromonosporaceae bacterium]
MNNSGTAGVGQAVVPGGTQAVRPAAHPRGFFAGMGFLGRGLGMYRTNPGLMALGLLPALISFVALVAAFVAMLFYVDDVVDLLTPYMNDWPTLLRDGLRVVAIIAVGLLWVILSFLGYVTLTLIIGQPFYEAISKRVEDHLGGVPGEINVSFWRSLPRILADAVRLAVRAAIVAVALFFVQLIPVAGNAVAIVLGALFGGWALTLELTGVAFERRGLYYRHRKRSLRQHRRMTIGFGAATFVCFLIPLGAVIFMPAAVAGATLLSRRILGPET